jgi:hypothetical protein
MAQCFFESLKHACAPHRNVSQSFRQHFCFLTFAPISTVALTLSEEQIEAYQARLDEVHLSRVTSITH